MQKHTLIGGIVLLAGVGALILYAAMRPVPAQTPTESTTSTLPASTFTEHAPYYDIVANYASSTPLGGNANSAAVTLMKDFVATTVAEFKTNGNFDHLTPEDIAAMGFDQGRKETLQMTYLIASSARTISYICTVYEDTLGAHGNSFFRTFTFDTQTGALLTLSDIFLPQSSYLTSLSSASRTKLPTVIGEYADAEFIKNGTTPDAKNFENFFFDNRNFVILFNPYQVAPYAAGPQTLRIPTSELSNILKPEYR